MLYKHTNCSPVILSLLLITSCSSPPESYDSLFRNKKIPNDCIHELVRPGSFSDATDCWTENSFDIKKFTLKHKNHTNKKKKIPIGSEEDLANWLHEKSRGHLSGWEYIGSIGDYSIILTSIESDTWRHYDLTIIMPQKGMIKITDQICGLKNSELLSARIDGNKIIYRQNIDGESLFNLIQEKYPKQWVKLTKQDKERFSITRGYCEYESKIDGNGKIVSTEMLLIKN